jgi:hypothetical protein
MEVTNQNYIHEEIMKNFSCKNRLFANHFWKTKYSTIWNPAMYYTYFDYMYIYTHIYICRSYFLDLGSSWRWVVSFTPLPLYPRWKNPQYPLGKRLGWPQSRYGQRGEEKILYPTVTRTPTPRSSSHSFIFTHLFCCFLALSATRSRIQIISMIVSWAWNVSAWERWEIIRSFTRKFWREHGWQDNIARSWSVEREDINSSRYEDLVQWRRREWSSELLSFWTCPWPNILKNRKFWKHIQFSKSCVLLNAGWWTESKNSLILNAIHHRQNLLELIGVKLRKLSWSMKWLLEAVKVTSPRID